MFRGHFEYLVDQKGRIAIPAKFREILSASQEDRLIITNFDSCLWAYPVSAWQELEKKISKLPQFLPEVKSLQRVFISAACECNLDKQGRFILPISLKEYAQIEKDVMIIGMTQRIEIWAKKRWEEAFAKAQENLNQMQDKLAELGL